ncbi:PQQ-binding-like beta-propeller repeat protein [Actinomycetospora sp.]|uniref:PQQ-binding-like beta-propeller repeat protein n=1 Tax=Actinomycetospora sp. TaxID=1872135 RepID=UPI0039C8A0E2
MRPRSACRAGTRGAARWSTPAHSRSSPAKYIANGRTLYVGADTGCVTALSWADNPPP